MATDKIARRIKIKKRIRATINGTASSPRLSVFRSNKYMYAQLIDDERGVTLTSASSKEIAKDKSANIEISKQVGKILAEKATKEGITKVVFDRNGYLYHGKVKAIADGAREGGLVF